VVARSASQLARELTGLRRLTELAVSPDGSAVAFVAADTYATRREGAASQLWLHDVVRAVTTEVSAREVGVRSPAWSPSGSLAFVTSSPEGSRIGPGPGATIDAVVEDLRWLDDSAVVALGTPTRTPGPRTIGGEWRRLFRAAVDNAQASEIGPPDTAVWEFDCGGGRIVALTSGDASPEGWYGAVLSVLDGDEWSAVYRPASAAARIALSPDGRVALVEGYVTDRGLVRGQVRVVDLETGTASTVAPAIEDATWLGWSGDALYVAGWEGMDSFVARVEGDAATELWRGSGRRIGTKHAATASVAASLLAVSEESPAEPPELALIELPSPAPLRRVTNLNRQLVPLANARRESLAWRSADDLEIQGEVVLPLETETPPPIVVVVHGGPTGLYAPEFAPLSGVCFPLVLAAAGYTVLLPNPRGSAGRGESFARGLIRAVGGLELDDLLTGVDACAAAGLGDGSRVGIMGNSWGGFMAAYAPTATPRFSAAVASATISDWTALYYSGAAGIGSCLALFEASPVEDPEAYRAPSAVLRMSQSRTPVLVIHGAADEAVPPAQGIALYKAAREAGLETELVLYPREGHVVMEREHQVDFAGRVVAWFDRHLRA
jgi:dipeptidyl aminopeptidase/acylaminoacyl peptidase